MLGSSSNYDNQWWREQNNALLDGKQETKDIRVLKPEDAEGRLNLKSNEFKKIIQSLNKLNNMESDPSQFHIYAWATKACTAYCPPGLIEEVILMVKYDNDDKYKIFSLCKKINFGNAQQREWGFANEIYGRLGYSFSQEYDHLPNEKDNIDFLKSTTFGNNEIHPYFLVLGVISYVKNMDNFNVHLLLLLYRLFPHV
jgi:hypothetical protein